MHFFRASVPLNTALCYGACFKLRQTVVICLRLIPGGVCTLCNVWSTVGLFKQGFRQKLYVNLWTTSYLYICCIVQGVIDKLPYLKNLSVNAILLSSVFESEHERRSDYGYEITNHTNIQSIYGSADDLHHLIDAAHNESITQYYLTTFFHHTWSSGFQIRFCICYSWITSEYRVHQAPQSRLKQRSVCIVPS